MTFTHALSTNNYGPAKFIVATSPANGSHTTLTAAMAAASVGDTIFLRNSVTENVTITPGVNIAAWQGSSLNTPSITGKLTMTGAGTSTISGITLITNSDFFLAVTGSAASIITLKNCYLNCLNNTGISFTSANTSALIEIDNCFGDVGTTGISLFTASSTGQMSFINTIITNSGSSTTASTSSATVINSIRSNFNIPFTTSSTGALNFNNTIVTVTNTTCITTAGTAATNIISGGQFASGSASAISVGSGTTLGIFLSVINSSNTNAITGAGTLNYAGLAFAGSSSLVNTTTKTGVGVPGANGTSGQILTANGAGLLPTFQTASSVGGSLVLIQTQTVTSSTASVVFTTGITSTYNTYIFVIDNYSPVTTNGTLQLQISANGGSSYVATGYVGAYLNIPIYTSGAWSSSNTVTTYIRGPGSVVATTQPYSSSIIECFNVTNGNQPTFLVRNVENVVTLGMYFELGASSNSTTTINAFQFNTNTGNISKIIISLYGLVQ